MAAAVLVGTRKGLFVLTGDETRREWAIDGPHLTGWEVFHAVRDHRDGTLHAATNNFVYGATVHRSSDGGRTWERSEGIGLPEDSGLTLEKTWHVEPGRANEPGRLWLGAAPGALFRTDDGGTTWEPVRSLLEDPTRDRWQPGAGGMCTHSIQLDPSDPQRMYVGISAAGVFRSRDGGASWELLTEGLPQSAWQAVKREGMSFDRHDPVGIYLGTQSGSLFVSPDGGGEWLEAAHYLPEILSVEAAEWRGGCCPPPPPPRGGG